MKNEYISIKDFAAAVGVSQQYIYKQLNNKLKDYVELVENKKMLKKSALELFNKNDNSTKVEQHFNQVEQPVEQHFSKVEQQIIDMLQQNLELLRKELEEKGQQLKEKDKHIAELTELAKGLEEKVDQAHKLIAMQTQYELEDRTKPTKPEEPIEPTQEPKKKKWWRFGR